MTTIHVMTISLFFNIKNVTKSTLPTLLPFNKNLLVYPSSFFSIVYPFLSSMKNGQP